MQFSGGKKPPVGILFDSDFGASVDSVLALALLHGLETKTEARIAAITISNASLQAAQLCDVIEKFYAGPVSNLPMASFQALAIGLLSSKTATERPPVYQALFTKQDAEGKAVYVPRIRKLNDTAVPEVLLRNALSAQYEGNGAIVCSGPSTNLARLLALPGAKDLIAAKVRMLVVAGAVSSSIPAGWPTPVTVVPEQIGSAFAFPALSLNTDFSYTPAHPVADFYRAAGTMPYDAPATAAIAALYAARPTAAYFSIANGKLQVDPSQKAVVLAALTQLVSAKPQPRVRRPPVVVDEEKVDEKKAEPKDELKKPSQD